MFILTKQRKGLTSSVPWGAFLNDEMFYKYPILKKVEIILQAHRSSLSPKASGTDRVWIRGETEFSIYFHLFVLKVSFLRCGIWFSSNFGIVKTLKLEL